MFLIFLKFYDRTDDYVKKISTSAHLKEIFSRKLLKWCGEYHQFWDRSEHLNQKIFLILLISKYRKRFINFSTQIIVKGISCIIIKHFCNLNQN